VRVNQLCARIEFGDAVSNHVLAIDRALKRKGHESRIYASTLDEFGSQVAEPDSCYERFVDGTDDLLVYHYSVFNQNYRMYLKSAGRRVLVYHNITPPEFFAAYDKGVAEFCRLGRDLLGELQCCDLALGDSEFNRLELVDAGFDGSKTGVLPIFVDYRSLLEKAGAERTKRRGTFEVLFVGRRVPNKRIEDVIRAFAYYHRAVNSDSHLYLVGASWVDRYDAQLRWLVDSLALWDSITMTGRVSDSELAMRYSAADVFLSMSDHEGFAVPLVESMAFDVPVLAYSSTAIPYTLKGAGLTFSSKDYARVGELMELLRTDRSLRDSVLDSQRKRLEAFSPEAVESALFDAVERATGARS